MQLRLLTITVWKMENGLKLRPALGVFSDWDVFWEYIKDCKLQQNNTLVFSCMTWALKGKLEHQVKPSKNMGFWTVELHEK